MINILDNRAQSSDNREAALVASKLLALSSQILATERSY